jgi:hypothetical protein
MSGMEPEVKNFLSKIVTSFSTGLLWLLINSTIGIYFNLAFFENKPSTGNYIFYVWFLVSIFFLIKLYRRIWKF